MRVRFASECSAAAALKVLVANEQQKKNEKQ